MPFQFIKKLEEERGDLHRVIPPLVNEHGQARAGRMLGVSAATINKWLKENGYRKFIVYRKEEKAS